MIRLISLSAVGALLAGCAAATPRPAMSATSAVPAHPGARACAGIPEEDRNKGPFFQSEAIASITPLIVEEYPRSNPPLQRMAGAIVTVRAGPGMTAEWLQRLVDCQLAHNAALAQSAPDLAGSPLIHRGTVATVRSTGSGFAIEIRSNEPKIATEILARAQRLYQQRQLAAQVATPHDPPR